MNICWNKWHKVEQEYTKQRKSSRKPKLAVIETTNIELIDEELQELLEGLE